MPVPDFIYTPPQDPIEILYQDDAIMVINKPCGLLSVPGKHKTHTMCVPLAIERQTGQQVRIVHRLDMDTSGVMVLALTPESHRHLGLQFERRHVHKIYHAYVLGCPSALQDNINLPLRCDWPNRPKQRGDFLKGKKAHTFWRVITPSANALLELTPHTGRSHQLRVHLWALGHPVLGDRFYASQTCHLAPRFMLHATQLTVRHPNGGCPMKFSAPLPAAFQHC